MKRLSPFSFIKKYFSTSRSESYILISGGLTGFFFIFLLNAISGIYSIYGLSSSLNENMKAIDLARKAQIALHEQILSWENILVSGDSNSGFINKYHEFSEHSQNVQNILFNLKLQNSGETTLPEDIEKLRIKHKAITMKFTNHIVDISNKNFKNIEEKICITRGMEDEIINSLSDIVERTEIEVRRNSNNATSRFIMTVIVSSFVFIILIFYFGREIGKRLLKTQNTLEKMVQQRTKDYVEANLSLQKEIDQHKITEQKLILSRNETEERNLLLTLSEKKYRYIVEGTSDVIFTVDERWYFKSANDAIKTEFKISPEAVTKYKLTDLIHDELTDATILRKIITEKLEESRKNNTTVRFNAQIKTPNLIEPVEFKISLEFIKIEGHNEIIGKAVRISDDRFSEFFVSEKCEYSIKNLLFTADDITHRITGNLQKYIEKSDINTVRIGLREIILNSIEHGNLNISFDEKTSAILNDRYFEFINERQSCPEHRDKRVKIEYLISQSKAIYKISDEGKGFNHRKFLSGLDGENEILPLAHGRGIAMARSIFDELKFNSKGNQVLLVKYLNKDRGRIIDENGQDGSQLQYIEIS